jgi:hypothetical protein
MMDASGQAFIVDRKKDLIETATATSPSKPGK